MAIRHIIFDCDGVLVDSEILTAEFEADLLARFGVHLSPEVIKERFAGRTARGQWLELASEYNLDLPPGFIEHRKRLAKENFTKRLKPIPHVRETLHSLEPLITVASNSERDMLELKLTVTGLIGFFADRRLSVDDVARPKPAPDLYREALARAGIARLETLVVEDTPTGIAAAMAAGISVLGFVGASHNTPGTPGKLKEAGAFAVLDDMRKLPALIAAM
ncbi:MAG TPA: HAD family phosphatase [Aestuariivirgaceae bacterium]|jgi:HAD superfamily hydrolase (TIGR01509 family)